MAEAVFNGIKFTDADVVNPDDYDSMAYTKTGYKRAGAYVPYLLHDHGFVVAVVFAQSEQDALDEAVDNDKLDHLQVDLDDISERADYMTMAPSGMNVNDPDYVDKDGGKWWWKDGRAPACLGNAGEPFDIEALNIIELPNPPFSFAAMFAASQQNGYPETAVETRSLTSRRKTGNEC